MIEEEVAAEEEAKTGEEEMVRITKASSLSKKMETKTPEEEVEATEAEVTEAPGEAAAKPVKVPTEVTIEVTEVIEVAQDHQEVTDLQEPEELQRKVIFQESPLLLLIQPQCLTSRWSEGPELDQSIIIF